VSDVWSSRFRKRSDHERAAQPKVGVTISEIESSYFRGPGRLDVRLETHGSSDRNDVLIDAEFVKWTIDCTECVVVEWADSHRLQFCETSVPEEVSHVGEDSEMGSERRAEILDLAHLHGAVQAVVFTVSQLGIEVAVGHRVVRVV